MLARLETMGDGSAGGASLQLLTGGAHDLPSRQQTLREAVRWSYDLLAPAEQVLFRRLAMFVGGCTLDTVEQVVCGVWDAARLPTEQSSLVPSATLEPVDILAGLESLVDSNLLRQEPEPDGEPRFRMLFTIRQFAAELLAASGEV